jgi:Zn-dependent protease
VKTFYRLNIAKLTYREYSFNDPWLVVIPIVSMIKLFRFPLPKSADDPPVETLAPFEVSEEELPEEVRSRFAPLAGELAELGFGQPIFHQIHCVLQETHLYWATFAHRSGLAAARIHHRVWSTPGIHKSFVFPVFISESGDGSFLVSSAGKQNMLAPESVEVHYHKGAGASELWQEHQARMDERLPGRAVDLRTSDRVREMVERHHAALRDFHLGRGVFRPVSGRDQKRIDAACEPKQVTAVADAPAGGTPVAPVAGATVVDAVLARLEMERTKRPSWLNFALILVISLAVFLAAGMKGGGMKDMDRGFLLLLVPILLFHELGHYVAMRCFGYRNLRMFFIPFFGAAVWGKHYNVAGWKKALVALAGPVPSIFAGGALGVAGLVMQQKAIVNVAALAMILNGLNLLPFLPLDGGWVAHAVLFCRHPVLDLGFRVVGILGLFGLTLLIGGYLAWFGVFLLLGLPAAWQVANVAHRLRGREAIAVSADGVSIPEDAARTILAELGAGKNSRQPANFLAQQVTSIFETLNARPPGPLASAALLVTHGGSFFLSVALVVVFFLFRPGGPLANRNAPPPEPKFEAPPLPYIYTPGNSEHGAGKGTTFKSAPARPGRAPGTESLDLVTIVASYATEAEAQAAYAALPVPEPGPAGEQSGFASRFGQTVLVTLPGGNARANDLWKDRLARSAKEVVVVGQDVSLTWRFSCTLPSEEEAEQLLEELDAFFNLTRPEALLPAWSSAWSALPAGRRQAFEKARRTLGRLAAAARLAGQDPEVQALRGELKSVFRLRDQEKIRQHLERQTQALDAAEERLVAEVAADEGAVDPVVVELWQRRIGVRKEMRALARDPDRTAAREKNQALLKKQGEIVREMARRAGALAAGGPDEAKSNLTGCAGYAVVKGTGQTVFTSALDFRCPGLGLPAFAEWLAGRHTSDIRYGYDAEKIDLREDPDDD